MVHLSVGDIVTVRPQSYENAGGYGYTPITDRMNDSGKLRITRVYNETVIVRGPLRDNGEERSINVGIHNVRTVNGVDRVTGQPPVIPRKLGVKPEDTPEQTFIGIDHPGIQWLFEDMSAFAEGKNWCRQYDDLAEELGIPGREQEYEVEVTRGDITFYATVTSVSLGQAHAKAETFFVDAE